MEQHTSPPESFVEAARAALDRLREPADLAAQEITTWCLVTGRRPEDQHLEAVRTAFGGALEVLREIDAEAAALLESVYWNGATLAELALGQSVSEATMYRRRDRARGHLIQILWEMETRCRQQSGLRTLLQRASARRPVVITTAILLVGIALGLSPAVRLQAKQLARDLYAPQPLPCGNDDRMVQVPAGEFLYGSTLDDLRYIDQVLGGDCPPNDRKCVTGYFDDEIPQQTKVLPSFCIDRYEVTNAQFSDFVAATKYTTTAEARGSSDVWVESERMSKDVEGADWKSPEGPASSLARIQDHPVVHVSARDAQSYCKWRGGRLPTRWEWEKAARGTNGDRFPWGDKWDPSRLNYAETVPAMTRAVGSYPSGMSPYGLFDALGNVTEWVLDQESSPTETERRGGSFPTKGLYSHVAWHSVQDRGATNSWGGFRCVKEAPPLPDEG